MVLFKKKSVQHIKTSTGLIYISLEPKVNDKPFLLAIYLVGIFQESWEGKRNPKVLNKSSSFEIYKLNFIVWLELQH